MTTEKVYTELTLPASTVVIEKPNSNNSNDINNNNNNNSSFKDTEKQITESILPDVTKLDKITFLVLGLSTLNVWNTVLALDIKNTYYAFQMTGLVIASVGSLFIKVPRYFLPYCCMILILLCGGFQLGHNVFSESGFNWYCIFSFFLIGMSSGLAQTLSFSLSATKKENLSGYVNTGFGLSGVIGFALNLLSETFISDNKIYKINRDKLIFLYAICEACLIIAILLSIFNLKLTVKSESDDKDYGEEKSLSHLELLKASYKSIFCIFIVNWLTLQLFPSVGFQLWKSKHNLSDTKVTILLGMFQIADFISRYAPNIAHIKYFKYFTFSTNTLIICNILRFGFVAWFVLNSTLTNSFFSNIVQQCICMFLFAFTNGWFNVIPFLNFVGDIKQEKNAKDIQTVANYLVIALFLGLCAGIWTGLLYPLVIN